MRSIAAILLCVATACGPLGQPSLEQVESQAREVLSLADPVSRSLGFAALLSRAEPDSLPGLRAALDDAVLDAGEPELVSFATWWAGFDPEGALAWTQEDWRGSHPQVVRSLFRVWGRSDAKAAFERTIGGTVLLHDAALAGLIAGWYHADPDGLRRLVLSTTDLAARQKLAEMLAERVVLERGAEGAARWAGELGDPRFREIMAVRIASSAAWRGEGQLIADWATPQVAKGDESISSLPRRIGTRWILREPEAALAWLKSLPAGKDRDDGVMESFRDWMRVDPELASAWLAEAPVERWLEPGLSIWARYVSRENPRVALDLVAQFSDEELRRRITLAIGERWAKRDPEGLRDWLAQNDVAPDARKRLTRNVEMHLRLSEQAENSS